MTDSLFKLLTGVVLGILLSLLFKGCGGQEKAVPVGKPTVIRKVDTLYLPSKVEVQKVFVPKQVLTYLPSPAVHDTIYQTREVEKLHELLSQKFYLDTTILGKHRKVVSKLYVHGVADSLRVKLLDTTPTLVVKDSTVITQQVESSRWKLAAGLTLSPTSLSPGIQIGRGRHTFQGTYNLLPPTPTTPQGRIGVGYFYNLRK